jgi:hypothetical protein
VRLPTSLQLSSGAGLTVDEVMLFYLSKICLSGCATLTSSRSITLERFHIVI